MISKYCTVLVAIACWLMPLSATAQSPLDVSWLREYSTPASYDVVKDIAVDNLGGVVVTGTATVKYSPLGDTLVGGWTRPGGDAVEVDHDGNVFVISTVVEAGTGKNIITRKYDPNGVLLWERRYNGPANTTDSAVAIAIDQSGYAIVIGRSTAVSTGGDVVTIKYSPTGDTSQISGGWVRRSGSTDPTVLDVANDVEVGPSGSVYVLGSSCSNGCGHFVIKYTPSGDTTVSSGGWVRLGLGFGFNFGKAVALCVDAQGFIAVTGYEPHYRCCTPEGSRSDYVTARIDPSGTLMWSQIYGGFGYDSRAGDVEVDDQGYIYVTGFSRFSSDTNPDIVTVKYGFNGLIAWQSGFNGVVNSSHADAGKRLAIGSSGMVFVTGNSMKYNVYFEYDAQFATVAIDPANGHYLDSAYYDKFARGNEDVIDVEADTLGNVFVAGMSCEPYGNTNNCASTTMVTIKYGTGVISGIFDEPPGTLPTEFSVLQNYPNPFNGSTVIPISLEHDSRVSITVFNVLGQAVRSIIDADLPPGSQTITWDGTDQTGRPVASGVYFYRLHSSEASITKKMVLLR